MKSITTIPAAQLKRATDIKEQIEKLQGELVSIFSDDQSSGSVAGHKPRTPSSAVRQAKTNPAFVRRPMSAAARARLSETMKAKWAARKGQ